MDELEQSWTGKGLNPRQVKFIEEYLKSGNLTKAALAAGYSEEHAGQYGWNIVRVKIVAAEIKRRQELMSKRLGITRDKWICEVARVAFSDIGKAAEWNGNGVRLLDSGKLPADVRCAIQELSDSPKMGLKIKMYDKVKALELLGKSLGFTDREFAADDADKSKAIRAHAEALNNRILDLLSKDSAK